MTRTRWHLHPLVTALVLLAVAALGGVRALDAPPHTGAAAAGMLLALTAAGAAAGFANSGST